MKVVYLRFLFYLLLVHCILCLALPNTAAQFGWIVSGISTFGAYTSVDIREIRGSKADSY